MAADSIARVSVNRGVEAVEVPTVCDWDFAPLISIFYHLGQAAGSMGAAGTGTVPAPNSRTR